MMMGQRAPMKSGDEYDALTRFRKYRIWRAGDRAGIKRRFRRRERRQAKLGDRNAVHV